MDRRTFLTGAAAAVAVGVAGIPKPKQQYVRTERIEEGAWASCDFSELRIGDVYRTFKPGETEPEVHRYKHPSEDVWIVDGPEYIVLTDPALDDTGTSFVECEPWKDFVSKALENVPRCRVRPTGDTRELWTSTGLYLETDTRWVNPDGVFNTNGQCYAASGGLIAGLILRPGLNVMGPGIVEVGRG